MTVDPVDAHPLPPGQRETPWRPVHYGRVPRVDPERWSLSVGGQTRDGGLTVLDAEALDALPRVEVEARLHCVARTSTPPLRWGGVRMRELVALAPPEDGAEHVLLAAARGYAACVALADLVHPDSLLATHVAGRPLTPEQGWPARVVLPHLYGFKGPKWVAELTYHHRPQQGWWESHGYHPRARVGHEERFAHQG
jgi:DMSO/TMAO reductase YedYZ molybdopterin-dependent catalytic subunit